MTTGSEERSNNPTVEQRLLDAGVALWASEDPATLFGGLSVSSLAKAAGVTRATFYSYWPTTAEYMAALLRDLDRRRAEGYSAEVVKELSVIQSPNSDVLARFMAACTIRFSQTIDDPALRVRFGFISKMDDPDVADGLRSLYRSYEDDTQQLNNQMRTQWGREPRPPFTEEWIQGLFGALLDGISLRHVFDPERMPAESFALAGAMLMMLATRPTDDPRDVRDMLGSINQWPATGVRLSTSRRVDEVRSTAPLSGDTLRATIHAARRMLAEDNWVALNIDDIAIAVGIDADRLLRTFGSKIGLALAIIALNADEQWQETTRTDDPLADLQTLLDIILFELRRSPSLGQSVIQLLAGTVRLPDRLVFTSQPVPEIARLLAEAKQQGLILDSIDPNGLSISLTRIILAEGAPVTVSGVNQIDSLSYILEGIRVRS
jgi:AcrR family transcriptional regulator